MFKNMKIQVCYEQPLSEILRELGRLGYLKSRESKDGPRWIVCHDSGFCNEALRVIPVMFELTTLAELKEM